SVKRDLVIRRTGDRTQIAVLEDDVLVEHHVDRASHRSYVGNVYLGRVQNVSRLHRGEHVLHPPQVDVADVGTVGRPLHVVLTQIAVLEDDVLVEHHVDRASHRSYVGNVYLGRVQNVLPSMEAAFVDIGKGRNAVL